MWDALEYGAYLREQKWAKWVLYNTTYWKISAPDPLHQVYNVFMKVKLLRFHFTAEYQKT